MNKKVAPASWLTIADEGKRFRRQTRLLFGVVWLVPALLAAGQLAFLDTTDGITRGFGPSLLFHLAAWGVWALWSQLILTIVTHVREGGVRPVTWVAIHSAASLIIATVTVVALAMLREWVAPGDPTAGFSQALRATTPAFPVQVVLYWAVVAAAYMREFASRYQERDRLATELEQKLARTQLDALRMQLNPHFLFNALNSVSSLMDIDVGKAQAMLSRVSDLLRLSLRSAGSPTIPLWQEIELVELYLQVARVRYGTGLDIDIDVDPAAVDAPVPSFVLQPLIENALKHGLQPGRTDQRILVQVGRTGDTLELLVEDNGRGLDGNITNSGRFLAARPSVDGLGIGLTNTRSRLAMLYGDRYAFRMINTSGGGCRVEIRLPIEGVA